MKKGAIDMRRWPEWATRMLVADRKTLLLEVFGSDDDEQGVATLYRIHFLNALAKVMDSPPDSIEDPLLRLIVRLSDESKYSMAYDDSTWAAVFAVLRENTPKRFALWLNQNRQRFWLDTDVDEYAALVYEDSRGEIVERFPDLQSSLDAAAAGLQELIARTQAAATPQARQGGCYIATYVYGSYECPELWVLRRWRDDSLLKSAWGRAFVRFYYWVSPGLISHLGDRDVFARLCRLAVGRLVVVLERAGVSPSIYVGR